MKRSLAGYLGACALAVTPGCLPALAVEVPPDTGRVAVWPELRVAGPANRETSVEAASALAEGPDALSIDSPDRVLGRGTRPYWGLFALHNPGPALQTRFVALEATTQYDTRLYERVGAGHWRHVDSVADASGGKLWGGTPTPVWIVTLPAQHESRFMLRVEGPSVVRFPLFAYTPVAYAGNVRQVFMSLGLMLGICFFIALYILYLRRHLEDRSVLLFLAMLVGDLVGAAWLAGILGSMFPALPESAISQIGFAGFAVLFGFGCLHARVYLDTAGWFPGLDRALQAVGWTWLALAPWFAEVFPVAARVLLVWGGTAVALLIVVAAVIAARRRGAMSAFIAGAWASNLLMGLYFLIARVVDNPHAWSPSSLALTQATSMAIFFGLAMSQRLVAQRIVLAAEAKEAVMQRERAAALMRERSLLFAATNHDLRQPLLGVGMFVELLKAARTPQERDDYARKLDLAVTEVDGLLIGIQQLAAVHEASGPPPQATVRLDELLLPIIGEYRSRAASRRVTLRYVPSRVSISTHAPYFQRIVRNVLSNAIRYTATGDRILVGCRRAGGLHLVIADTGRGMSEEQTRRAFDAFERFDADQSVPDGFGLGLFSARTLAHAMGIEVSLQSRRGMGTEFRMFVPAAAPA